MFKAAIVLAALLFGPGCVKAVSTTAGAAANVGKAAVKTTANVSGDVVEAAAGSKDADNDHHHDSHHDDDPRPFDASRNAMMDVDAALAAAQVSGKNVLLALGGNWCHDSRGLAAKFERPELARVIADGYELVWVDVGYRDRNLDVPARYGVMELHGTPTILILSPDGALLNRDSVHDWRTADSKPYDETLVYFQRYAAR
ncbi:thioredoxin family protein [Hyphococcus sp.]|uniref:thioredoxin family protein n=1 Tax=Hyphococcus sp. TaxID=2038636 RepID=UPI003CCB9A57